MTTKYHILPKEIKRLQEEVVQRYQSETIVHNFIYPSKQILTVNDLQKFQQSEVHNLFVTFIVRLSDSVKGISISAVRPPFSQVIISFSSH